MNIWKKEISEALQDDLIILSDNDEIPNLESKTFKILQKIYFYLDNYFFITNLIFYIIKYNGLVQEHVKEKD